MNRIDLVLYINLDHREDRNEQILSELTSIGMAPCTTESLITKVRRISACAYPQAPAVGCMLSHIVALKYALSTGDDCQHILILEDDFSFTRGSMEINVALKTFFDMAETSKADQKILEWDCVLLSYGENHERKYYNNLVCRVFMSEYTSGYLIKKSAIPALVDLYVKTLKPLIVTENDELYACDMIWSKIMREGKWFMFNHRLGCQRVSHSDIVKTARDHFFKQNPLFIPNVYVIHDFDPSIIILREIMNRDNVTYVECQDASNLIETDPPNIIILMKNNVTLSSTIVSKALVVRNPDLYPRLTFFELLGQNGIYVTSCYVLATAPSHIINLAEKYAATYYKNLRFINSSRELPTKNVYKCVNKEDLENYVLEHVFINLKI